jgi:hypothetical protein
MYAGAAHDALVAGPSKTINNQRHMISDEHFG